MHLMVSSLKSKQNANYNLQNLCMLWRLRVECTIVNTRISLLVKGHSTFGSNKFLMHKCVCEFVNGGKSNEIWLDRKSHKFEKVVYRFIRMSDKVCTMELVGVGVIKILRSLFSTSITFTKSPL